MPLLRLAWILGFVSTPDYHARMRRSRYGAQAIVGGESAVNRLERTLAQDRLALVLFLLGLVLLLFTWVHGPVLA